MDRLTRTGKLIETASAAGLFDPFFVRDLPNVSDARLADMMEHRNGSDELYLGDLAALEAEYKYRQSKVWSA